MPPALTVRFDPAAARVQGWVTADASAEDVQKALLGFVGWRLRVAGVEHELVATADGAEVRTPTSARAKARELLNALGTCELYMLAEDGDFPGGLAAENARFATWRKEHPDRPLLEYNADPTRPQPTLAWLPRRWGTERGDPQPVLLPTDAGEAFGNRSFARVFPTTGNLSCPAVGFELTAERTSPFGDFTGKFVKRRMAVVIDSEVRSAPTLNSRLVGSAIIEGKLTDAEVKDLVTRIRAGGTGPVLLVE
jgi:preprotein translocase subunit SecD